MDGMVEVTFRVPANSHIVGDYQIRFQRSREDRIVVTILTNDGAELARHDIGNTGREWLLELLE